MILSQCEQGALVRRATDRHETLLGEVLGTADDYVTVVWTPHAWMERVHPNDIKRAFQEPAVSLEHFLVMHARAHQRYWELNMVAGPAQEEERARLELARLYDQLVTLGRGMQAVVQALDLRDTNASMRLDPTVVLL